MSNTKNQGAMCKSVCWLIGAAIGAYGAYMLVTVYGRDQVQSAVIGIVAMLLIGLLLRRLLCRSGRNAEGEVAPVPAMQPRKSPRPPSGPPPGEDTDDVVARIRAELNESAPDDAPADTSDDGDTVVDAVFDAEAPTDAPTVAPVEKAPVKTAPEDMGQERADNIIGLSDDEPVAPDADAPDKAAADEALAEALSVGAAEGETAEDALEIAADTVKQAAAEEVPTEDAGADIPASEPAVSEPVEVAPAAAEPAPQPQAAAIKPLQPKPAEAPEGGVGDDFQKIDGLDAATIAALHDAGIYFYAQFSAMNRRELAWIDEHIKGPQSAAETDQRGAENWRKQAILLGREAG